VTTSALPITLRSTRLRARIDPARGASLIDLFANTPSEPDAWHPVIARNVPGEDPLANPACFFMLPWVNRIDRATFPFHGRTISLTPDPRDGHAIHGDVRKRPWTILDRTPLSARLAFDSRQHEAFNWPWPLRAECTYTLHDGPGTAPSTTPALSISLTVENLAPEAFPLATGIHPYFPRTQHPADVHDLRIAAPVMARYDSRSCIPIGPARRDALARRLCTLARPAPTEANDSFVGLHGPIVLHWPRMTATLTSTPHHDHLVYFAPHLPSGPAPFIALEPQTASANAFNRATSSADHGTLILQPHQPHTFTHHLALTFHR
jgi:aldose 1-epimerase